MTAVLGLGAQRVDDAGEPDEGEVARQGHRVVGHRGQLVGTHEPGREREHPQALLAHPDVGVLDAVEGLRHRKLRATERASGPRAPGDDDVGGALDQLDDVLGPLDGHPVERRHELVLGVERHLGQPGVGAPGLGGVDAQLRGEHDEGRLRGVPDHRAVVPDHGVAVEHQAEGEAGEVRHRRPRHGADAARHPVALPLHGEPRAAGVEGRDHHLVQRQGARLVRVDGARGTEGLDVGEVLDDCLGIGELRRPHRQQAGDERRHPGRDRRDGHRGPQQQQLLDRHPSDQPDDDDDGDRTPRDDAEHLGQRVQLTLQWRTRARHRREHRRDLAHLGVHPRRRDDDGGGTARHRGVLEEHVRAVAESDVGGSEHAGILRDGGTLAGEGCFLRLEGRRAQDAAVGRHHVTCLELHDVPGDHLGRRDEDESAVAHDAGLRDLHGGEGVDAGAGGQLLAGAEADVEHDEQRDQQARRDLTDEPGSRRRPPRA